MSLKIDKVQLDIIINNDPARKSMRLLDEELKQATKRIKGLTEGTEEYIKESNNIKRIKTEMDNLKRQIGITGMTLKELTAHQRELNLVLSNMRPNTPEYNKLQKELKETTTRIKELRGQAANSSLSFKSMADGFNRYFGIFTAAIASLTGVIFGFKKLVSDFNEFEKKIDNLSSLTGLAGEELNWLSEQAKELSVSTVEGSVRITQSADDIVDAYTKVGSKRSELLKNKEALNQVTQEAIILSEAANSDLEPAVDGLTMVLNQFNGPASDSRRIINAMAAGSKEGAGEIPYLTQAIEKSGTVAADAGMSYEQLIGVIETLAPRITQPEIAGRNFKGVLLDLQKGADDTNPAIVGFSKAMENLAAKNLSTTELTKMFGEENITAAKILINNRLETEKYTQAVTNTNVAIEQATINTDNNSSKLAQAKNRAHLVALELGEKLAPAMTAITGWGTKLIRIISEIIDFFVKYKTEIVSVATGIAVYTIAVNAASIASKAYKIATDLATWSTKAFNTAMKSNPWGLVAGLVATAVAYLLQYAQVSHKVNLITEQNARTLQELNDLKKRYNDNLIEESARLNLAFDAAKKENLTKEERKVRIQKLIEQFPEYSKNLNAEKSTIEDITRAQKEANNALKNKIALQLSEEQATVIAKSKQNLEDSKAVLITYKNELSNAYKEARNFADEQEKLGKINPNKYSEGYTRQTAEKQYIGTKNTNDGFFSSAYKYAQTLISTSEALKIGKSGIDVAESTLLNALDNQLKGIDDQITLEDQKFDNISTKYNNLVDKLTDSTEDNSAGSGAGKETKGLKNLVSDLDKFKKLHQEALHDMELSLMEANSRELELIQDKYKKEIENAGLTEETISALKLKFQNEGFQKMTDTEKEQWKYFTQMRLNMYSEMDAKIAEQEKNDQAVLAEIMKLRPDMDPEAYRQYEEAKYEARKKYNLLSLDDEKQRELQELLLKNKSLLTTKEFEAAILNIEKRYRDLSDKQWEESMQKKTEVYKKYFNYASQAENSLSNIISNLKQMELDKAGENEEKKKAIMKKYADIEMAVNIAKIVTATALGAMQAYELGPVAGAIMSGLIIAEGIVELGVAIDQRNKIKGLETGLYPSYITATRAQDGKQFRSRVSSDMRTQTIFEPTVFTDKTGSPKFLAGERGRSYPEIMLDGYVVKDLQMNAPMVIDAIRYSASKIHGYEKGRYPDYITSNTGVSLSKLDIKTLAEFTSVMKQIADNGVSGKWSMYDFDKQKSRYDDAKNMFN